MKGVKVNKRDENLKRVVRFNMVLTEEEHAKVHAAAHKAGLSASAWVRSQLAKVW